MQIFVNTLGGGIITLEVEKSNTPDELKILICKKLKQEGAEHRYRVIFGGRQLSSFGDCELERVDMRPFDFKYKTLGEYGISESSTVWLLLRNKGGLPIKVDEFSSEDTMTPLFNPHVVADTRLGWHGVDHTWFYYYSLNRAPIQAELDNVSNQYYVIYENRRIWGPGVQPTPLENFSNATSNP